MTRDELGDIDHDRVDELCVKITEACLGYESVEVFVALASTFTVAVACCERIEAVDELARVFVREARKQWLLQQQVKGRPA